MHVLFCGCLTCALLCCCHQFRYEKHAARAVQKLNSRWFNGRPIHAEMSPVTDFREACCRQYEMGFVSPDFQYSLRTAMA